MYPEIWAKAELFKTNNTVSEWNMFIDPTAAKSVFRITACRFDLVPLDATQRVPIDMALFEQFQSHAGIRSRASCRRCLPPIAT